MTAAPGLALGGQVVDLMVGIGFGSSRNIRIPYSLRAVVFIRDKISAILAFVFFSFDLLCVLVAYGAFS